MTTITEGDFEPAEVALEPLKILCSLSLLPLVGWGDAPPET
jgi:hypothetical protein